jgi:hypothetical protein
LLINKGWLLEEPAPNLYSCKPAFHFPYTIFKEELLPMSPLHQGSTSKAFNGLIGLIHCRRATNIQEFLSFKFKTRRWEVLTSPGEAPEVRRNYADFQRPSIGSNNTSRPTRYTGTQVPTRRCGYSFNRCNCNPKGQQQQPKPDLTVWKTPTWHSFRHA